MLPSPVIDNDTPVHRLLGTNPVINICVFLVALAGLICAPTTSASLLSIPPNVFSWGTVHTVRGSSV
jgi:hypothetical protein